MKKRMPKFFAALFALVLMACMAVPAYAAEVEPADTGESVVAYSGVIAPRASGSVNIHSNDGIVKLYDHWSIFNYSYNCFNLGSSQVAVTFKMTNYNDQGVAPGGSCQFSNVSGTKTLSVGCQSYGSASVNWINAR